MSTLAQSFWFGPLGPFGSPGMLLWGSAAAIPIVIHLLSRRRFDEVPWAAMDFLMAALRKHARRWRLEQLILLLVRASILALLSIALANPVLSLWHSPPRAGSHDRRHARRVGHRWIVFHGLPRGRDDAV